MTKSQHPLSKRFKVFGDSALTGTKGWGLPSLILKTLIDIAYAASVAMTVIFVIAFVVSIFVPLSSYSVAIDEGANARQMPLTRFLVVFVMSVVTIYFGGIVFILHNLRKIFRTILARDSFHPANIMRLRLIGIGLGFVTALSWSAQAIVASRLSNSSIEGPGLGELITPTFAVFITFTLAELFREGARLRRETELTI